MIRNIRNKPPSISAEAKLDIVNRALFRLYIPDPVNVPPPVPIFQIGPEVWFDGFPGDMAKRAPSERPGGLVLKAEVVAMA